MANDENKIILEFPATNVEIEFGETITFDNISGFLNSDRVTYNDESLTEEIAHLEDDKADNTKLASEYDEEETYYRGDIVLYNGVLYECDNTDASGEFNPPDWKEITLGEGIEDVRDLLANYYTKSQIDLHFLGKTNPSGTGYFSLNRRGSAGAYSVSVGRLNEASAQSSFAEGENNASSGYASHSEGYGNAASGLMAHAEGVTTESSGYGSHSEGVGTIANHIGQHVIGTYNVADPSTADPTAKGNYIEIVGNGTDDNRRRNARTLDWSGNETLMGDLIYNGNKRLSSEISRLDGRIDTKANASDVYTKSQTDNLLNGKADVSDLPDMSQYYDKSEVDDLLDDKADKSDTYTKEQVDDIVYNILPDDTASGSVANFETDLALPLKSLKVDVNAVQDLHGYSKPWSGGAGKNKCKPLDNPVTRSSGITVTPQADGSVILNGTQVGSSGTVITSEVFVKQGVTYIASIGNYDTNIIDFGIQGFGRDKKITYSRDFRSSGIQLFITEGTTLDNVRLYPQIEEGSTATSFAPYENICPIEGWNAITLDVNANTEVINLGGTYYGGHFTQDKDGHRQFEVTHGYIASYNGEVINEPWISSMDEYSQGATPTTGAQVVYPLATPIIIDLPDGEPIVTLNGTNNIYADTGDCAVEFKVSVEQYVSNHSGGSLGSSLRGDLLGSNPNTDESEDTGNE